MSIWTPPPPHPVVQNPKTTIRIRQLKRHESITVQETIHPLRTTWVFHYSKEGEVLRIGAFATLEDFWGLYTRLKPIDELIGIKSFLLKAGTPPIPVSGGRWRVRLIKGVSRRIWESLVFWLIGDWSPDIVLGATIEVFEEEDEVSFWTRNAGNGPENLKVRNELRSFLGDLKMDYLVHKS